MSDALRFRQVHLDFHTSGRIPGIGSRFDADAFAKAFRRAHVDSVTLFSKCHHGYSYHPTQVGEMHPHLDFDLTRAQLDALHAVGIKAPLYTTAAWDELAATHHPEWRIVSPDGGSPRAGTDPNGAGWAFLDFSTTYVDYLCRQVEEMMVRYPDADGVWIDIAVQPPTVSVPAQAQMDAMGLDWTDAGDRDRFTEHTLERFFERVHATVRKHDADMPLFYNSGHIQRGGREHYRRFFTHLELESLPTAGWGYEHFPLSARYVDTLGTDFLGMTGKFHYHWGEVGGYKKPDALLYECGAMLAHGARCSIGDHLHPTGAIDDSTMAVIAPAYAWVEAREAWVRDSRNRADVGVLSAEAARGPMLAGTVAHQDRMNAPDTGAVRVLLESKIPFDVLDLQSDLEDYRLVILPDVIAVDQGLAERLKAYLDRGGRVLATGRSGIHADTGPVLDIGARWHGTSSMSGGDYLLPVPDMRAEGIDDPLFMYRPSERLTVEAGESLGAVFDPYMNRDPRHFSGHVNAPSRPAPTDYAAGVRHGNLVHLAHPIFSIYVETGAMAHLEIAERAIRLALGGPTLVETSLPRAGRVTVRHQPGEHRDVVHLLHATPALRGQLHGASIQPIQDLITLADIDVRLRPIGTVDTVRLVPEGEPLTFERDGDDITFRVPRLRGHGMVEIAYAR